MANHYATYFDSLANAQAGDVESMVKAGNTPSIKLSKDLVRDQSMLAAASGEQMAQLRGQSHTDLKESANDVHLNELDDTEHILAGSQKKQLDNAKAFITSSLPYMGSVISLLGKNGLTDKHTDLNDFHKRLIKENSNALGTMTLSKATGSKLDQSFEGVVRVSKFAWNQSGFSIGNEAPIIMNSARTMLNQAAVLFTEADSIQSVGQWSNAYLKNSWSVVTKDLGMIATSKMVLSAKTAFLFGQDGLNIADKKLVSMTAEGGSQIRMDKDGNTTIYSTKQIVLRVGQSTLVISSDRIDLNPSTPPDVRMVEIKVQYFEPPEPAMIKEKGQAELPIAGPRNPVPGNIPYATI